MSHLSSQTLDLYLDDELAAGERRAVESHLEACAHCRGRLAGLRELFVALDTLQSESIPVDLAPRVLERVSSRARLWVAGAAILTILAAQVGVTALLVLWPVWPVWPVWPGPGDWFAHALSIVSGTQSQGSPGPLAPDSLLAGAQGWLGNIANQGAGLLERIDPVQWWVALAVGAILWLVGNRLLIVPTERNTGKWEAAL